jgi:hypothetical protein
MPNFPWPDHRDVPEIGDTSLAALLAGSGPRVGSLPELQPIADILAALTAGPPATSLPVSTRPWPSSGTGSACPSWPAGHAIGGAPRSPRCCPGRPRPSRSSASALAAPSPASGPACPPPSGSRTTRSGHLRPVAVSPLARRHVRARSAHRWARNRQARQRARVRPARRRSACAPPTLTPGRTAPASSRRPPPAVWRRPPAVPPTWPPTVRPCCIREHRPHPPRSRRRACPASGPRTRGPCGATAVPAGLFG